MEYSKEIVKGTFLARPNRFIAQVEVAGRTETVHVKNTGRCRELLLPGAPVYLEDHRSLMGQRKTGWDLIAVEKRLPSGESMLINMDSQAPNKAVEEGLWKGSITIPQFPKALTLVKGESFFGGSRFDFYVEGQDGAEIKRAYVEVKGVTLEVNGTARFPDAPTERGIKHVRELCEAKRQGFFACVIFIVQMKPIFLFEPNDETHPQFGEALREAEGCGVHILAYDCHVTPGSMRVGDPILVSLNSK